VSPLARAASLAEVAVGVLDGGRRWLWRHAARTDLGRTCARDRSTRILALGLGHILVAFTVVGLVPLWLLLLSPLVLGVPHVVADVRYLVIRGPSLRPETLVALVVPLAAMTGLSVMEVMGGPSYPNVDVALGFAAIALAVSLAPASGRRRACVLAGVVALAVPAILAPYVAMMVLLHGHNVIAMVIWLCWTRRTVRLAHRIAILFAAIVATAALLAGVLDGIAWAGGPDFDLAPALAPGLDPVMANRLVLVYAFLQALHYVIWLRLIPSTQSQTPAASTFRRSLASLRADFGAVALAAIVVVALAVPTLACVYEPARVRDLYLSVALFHGWLELAVIGYLVVTRQRLGEPAA